MPSLSVSRRRRDLRSAKRIRLLSDTGTWKQTVIRVLLFGPVTTEQPVTFIQEHADAMIVMDRHMADAPLDPAF